MIDFRIPKFIPQWAENSLENSENILATSNQGTILLFKESGLEFVVKAAMGSGSARLTRQATLNREYEAYSRLKGVTGIPKCYGMVADRYLVLEHIRGKPFRDAEIPDREEWFAQLLTILRTVHSRGVGHGDLKSKGNLMITDRGRPCVMDFGTTVIKKEGFHPINNRMHEYLVQLDINAWVKHKYHGRYEDASDQDSKLLQYSRAEAILRRYRKWRDRKG
jgi:RIO-like serine/threonine protein kinase